MTIDALAVDFETTGHVPGFPNEPWQIGLVPLIGGVVEADGMFDSLLNIGERPFNKYAPGRHAQLRAQLAVAPTLHCLWPDLFRRLCGLPLVAHNIGTERSILSANAPLHVFGPWIDTLPLARRAWPGLESYALEHLVNCLGLDVAVSGLCPGRGPHDALYDASACAVLLLHLLEQPGWRDIPAEELSEMSGGF